MAKKSGPNLTVVAGGFAPPVDVRQLMEEDLARSGISMDNARELGMEIIGVDRCAQLGLKYHLPAMMIPYFDANGAALSPHPKWPQFFRARYLVATPPRDDGKPGIRYAQPFDSGLCAYFPRLSTVEWGSIVQDYKQTIVITEGEKKAAAGCLSGFYTIGLGGVNNYRSTREGIGFLTELEQINWVRRRVVLAFDSDFVTNPNVCAALKKFADELYIRGARPHIVVFSSEQSDGKVGLDDALVEHGADWVERLMEDAEPVTLSQPLWDMNERFVYCEQTGQIIETVNGHCRDGAKFKELMTANMYKREISKGGNISLERTSAASEWLQWPLRNAVLRQDYDPSQPALSVVEDTRTYNLWKGFAVQPREGSAELFIKLVDHLFTGAEEGAKQWFLQWCAYPIQHPGTKLYSAVMIHGLGQGTGKSLLFVTMGKIYGSNFTEIGQKNFHESFNGWAVHKQFVLGDDVTGLTTREKRNDLDLIKKMITQTEIEVNVKFQPTYTTRDCINYAFTSNHIDAMFLEDHDRRFFVHEVTVPALPDAFYKSYDTWLKEQNGAEEVMHYLKSIDMRGFNPAAKAFSTLAKDQMRQATRSYESTWVKDMLANPDELLVIGTSPMLGDLFTINQLVIAYADHQGIVPDNVKKYHLSMELSRSNVRQVNDGKPIRAKGEKLSRYYAVRNADKWLKASVAEIQSHLESPKAKVQTTKRGKF